MNGESIQQLDTKVINILQCPNTKEPLSISVDSNGFQVMKSHSGTSYQINSIGIPLFAEEQISKESKTQQAHYDTIAQIYQENLEYPHTLEYTKYLDNALREIVNTNTKTTELGYCLELCCGTGEAIKLFGQFMTLGIGIDISQSMLNKAYQAHKTSAYFIQGDATNIPIKSETIDSIIMLGGIHHVPDRQKLFFEISRILKPNGIFIYREPVSDLWLWKALRAVIYRLSPTLDHETERPLLFKETVPLLSKAGLDNITWQTFGFIGFCIFMNSDVLWFNRFFKYVPGIKSITKFATMIDHTITSIPLFRNIGLQVIGVAQKKSAPPPKDATHA